jgi:DNA modification methylase
VLLNKKIGMAKIELIKGDCLIEMQNIADGSIDCIICDLPYGTTACKWDIIIPFEPLWEHYKRVIKKDGAIVLFGSEPFSSHLRMSNIDMYKYDWIWEKEQGTNFALSGKQPLREHENISVFYKSQPFYNNKGDKHETPQKVKRGDNTKSVTSQNNSDHLKESTYTHKTKSTIIKFQRDRTNIHQTQKPLDLIRYLIQTYTEKNQTILDNTMGSGTTGLACYIEDRNFIGIEMNENYFNIAEKRIKDAQMQPKLF